MWWRVSNPGNSYASIEVVATSQEEAIEKALGNDGYPSWANTRQSIVAEPVRPYEEKPAQQAEPQGGRPNDPNGRYAIVPRSDPALYGSTTGNRWGTPDYQFRFNMGNPAEQAQGRYVLQAWAARNNVVPADYMVVDTEQWDRPADAASGGIIDIEPDVAQALPGSTTALAQQRTIPGTFTGAWKVLVNGEEVHRFSGIGNNQGDANRVAAQWLRNNGRGVSGEGFEVVPIMTEGLAESASDYELHDRPKLDGVLAKCCRMVVQGQRRDPERYGQVAACVIDPDNRMIYGINLPAKDGTRRHAERVAIDKYTKAHGEIPQGSIVVTTCSPCNSPMEERHGESCKDLLNSVGIHKVYAGYQDPTQHDDSDADFRVYVTENDQLWGECQLFAQTFLGAEELAEAPLADYQPIGDFDKPGPFRGADKKLIPHPVNQLKAQRFFEKTPYNFRLFFSNIPGTGKYSEYGIMDPDTVKIIFGDAGEQIVAGHENAITVVYVGNSGDSKVMLTPWMMAHRLGHAIQVGARGQMRNQQQPWKAGEDHFFGQVNSMLEEYYGKSGQPGGNLKAELTPEYNALFNAMGTQRSSRSGEIRRPYEFLYEIFAQYLGTGTVTFNALPANLGYGRRVWGNPSRYLNIKPEYRDETVRKQAAEVLSYDMELMFNDALSNVEGKILVM